MTMDVVAMSFFSRNGCFLMGEKCGMKQSGQEEEVEEEEEKATFFFSQCAWHHPSLRSFSRYQKRKRRGGLRHGAQRWMEYVLSLVNCADMEKSDFGGGTCPRAAKAGLAGLKSNPLGYIHLISHSVLHHMFSFFVFCYLHPEGPNIGSNFGEHILISVA